MGYSKRELIAAALFDFVGGLTSREAPITFSARHVATPAADAVAEFLKKRGLGLDEELPVNDWSDHLSTPPARVLTPEMLESVEALLSCMNLANWHDDPIAIRARAAFGIEEG